MGGIWMANQSFVDSFIELIGFKAGLVITPKKLLEMIAETDPDIAARLSDFSSGMRIASDVYEELVAFLLYKVGRLESPRIGFPSSDVYHRFKHDPEAAPLIAPVGELYVAYMTSGAFSTSVGSADGANPFLVEAHTKFGDRGADIALEFLRASARYLQRTPWQNIRHVEWEDTKDLEELFASEKLETMYGRFFDQRFIDYVAQNFSEIDDIHWRQFEAATAEHFDRQGFNVELGPGRNDDGIDVRVFPKESTDESPPLMIIQCKRERRKIGKMLVKSVYADVVHEKAQSGLIVTTSELSPGAETMRRARGYPVETADRETVREWLQAMRTAPL